MTRIIDDVYVNTRDDDFPEWLEDLFEAKEYCIETYKDYDTYADLGISSIKLNGKWCSVDYGDLIVHWNDGTIEVYERKDWNY